MRVTWRTCNHELLSLGPKVSDSVQLRWGREYISNKFHMMLMLLSWRLHFENHGNKGIWLGELKSKFKRKSLHIDQAGLVQNEKNAKLSPKAQPLRGLQLLHRTLCLLLFHLSFLPLVLKSACRSCYFNLP